VKLIGDEILYTTSDPRPGCAIALELAAAFSEHPRVPTVRAGVAAGDVMLRDGDVFGPVVNLAARAVKVANPGEIVASQDIASAAGRSSKPLGKHVLKGFDDQIQLCRVLG
jgi:adenylate cyclase